MLKKRKACSFTDNRYVELFAFPDEIVGKVRLIDGDADAVWLGCDLSGGIDDTSAVFLSKSGSQNEKAISQFINGFVVHFFPPSIII